MTFLPNKLASVRGEIEKTINAIDGSLLSMYPVEEYISFFDARRRIGTIRFVPDKADLFCQSIVARTDRNVLEEYHKLALVVAMSQFEERRKKRNITQFIQNNFEKYFEAIMANMEKPKNEYYLHKNEEFSKDFAVCRMKLWPCGVELVDEYSVVPPRRVLLKGSLQQFLTGLPFFVVKVGGFSPLFETHVPPRIGKDFTPDGYARHYLAIAELLEKNPNIKGMVSGSWWHDPALEHVSPNLRFLTKVPEDGGARIFRVGTDPAAVRNATRFSLERAKLYREGKYTPRVYVLVWARADLLRWAKDYGGQTASPRPGRHSARARSSRPFDRKPRAPRKRFEEDLTGGSKSRDEEPKEVERGLV